MATSNKNLSAYDKSKIKSDADLRIGIVVSEWNDEITSNLCKGAIQTLLENNVLRENIKIQKGAARTEFMIEKKNFLCGDEVITDVKNVDKIRELEEKVRMEQELPVDFFVG